MAAPNLKEPTTIVGKTNGYAVTTSLAAALSNGAASGKVLKVNSVYAANVDGAFQFGDVPFILRRSTVLVGLW